MQPSESLTDGDGAMPPAFVSSINVGAAEERRDDIRDFPGDDEIDEASHSRKWNLSPVGRDGFLKGGSSRSRWAGG